MNYLFSLSMISTNESTNITKNIYKKLQSGNEYDKEYFCKKDNLIKYLKNNFPTFFEQFELSDFINRGSQGYVYKGKNKISSDNKECAFKFYIKKRREDENKKQKKDKKKEEQNFKEILILKKLHHPNIIKFLDLYKINEDSYFSTLELGVNGDLNILLKKVLKRNVLSETCINYFAKPILESLQYIHRCKIFHLDIKPGNIVVDSELNPKLTDFSVSCSFNNLKQEDLVKFPFVGTGKYIAPEILNRKVMQMKYGEKIDIYSFGVTLYVLAFGTYPYNLNDIKGNQFDSILEMINKENLIFPQDIEVSEKFRDFLSKILEKDYKKRITIKNALNHPWIKGHQILYDEKENLANNRKFLIYLITNGIPKFNEYIK